MQYNLDNFSLCVTRRFDSIKVGIQNMTTLKRYPDGKTDSNCGFGV